MTSQRPESADRRDDPAGGAEERGDASAGGDIKLETDSLRREYGDLVAVEGADLRVETGEFIAVLGPSGSGKTTLLQMIAGLESPTSGRVYLDGVDVTDEPTEERDIGLIFQNLALFRKLTVRENLGFAPSVRGASDEEVDEIVREVAETVDIDEALLDQTADSLNPSERQRVAIGRSIVAEPSLLLLDEPVDNLDEHEAINMRGELKKLQHDIEQTMVYVTHNQEEAMSLADRIVVMHQGEIQQVGTPHDLYHRPTNEFIAGFIGSPSMNFLEGTLTGSAVSVLGSDVPVDAFSRGRDDFDRLRDGEAVRLGIRPEDFSYDTTSSDVVFTVTLTELEPRGPHELLHAEGDGTAVMVLATQRTGLGPGDTFDVGVSIDDVHVIDPHTGEVVY